MPSYPLAETFVNRGQCSLFYAHISDTPIDFGSSKVFGTFEKGFCSKHSYTVTYRIQKGRSGVVSNCMCDTTVSPSSECVSIMKSRDGWWDKSVGTELFSIRNSGGSEPGLVPSHLSIYIGIRRIILVLVGEGMGYVCKSIKIRGISPPY